MTFTELRKLGQTIYADIESRRLSDQQTIEAMLEVYSSDYIRKQTDKVNSEQAEYVQAKAAEFREACSKKLAENRKSFDAYITTAPTTEQLNLLNALSLRGGGFDSSELELVMRQLDGNYQALKALKAIAKKAETPLVVSAKADYTMLKEQVDWTEQYLTIRMDDLSQKPKEMAFDSRCFFGEYADLNYLSNAVEWFD